ncbi:MAG: hypothetical protein ACO1Q7_20675 [Gemmatimonas sp.]
MTDKKALMRVAPSSGVAAVVIAGMLAMSSHAHGQAGRGTATPAKSPAPKAAAKTTPAPARGGALGGAWTMPDYSDLVERVIRRIVTQDKPAAVPIGDFKLRAFGREATLSAVRKYLGRDIELPTSVYASVAEWTDAVDKIAPPECAMADSTCVPASTVWLAVTKFERGDLPHEMNVWYTTSFSAKPHDQMITNRYSFCERWLRVGGTWKYDGFIRVTSGD